MKYKTIDDLPDYQELTMEQKLTQLCYDKLFPLINFQDQHKPCADIEKNARARANAMAQEIMYVTIRHKTWLE